MFPSLLKKLSICALFFILLIPAISHANNLKVFTSANPDSNAVQSFIIVPDQSIIPEGIKHDSQPTLLARQVPFIIELINPPGAEADIQWSIKSLNKHHKGIRVYSKYHGNTPAAINTTTWQSKQLSSAVIERNKLIFSPSTRTSPHSVMLVS